MSIPSVSAATSAAPTSVQAPPVASSVRVEARPRASNQVEIEIDAATQRPLPPRFPWLSSLSHQLGTASGQRPAFAPAPLIGDNLDRSA